MALGIDPKNDFAFKCVFGSERHTAILVDVLNAVLGLPPGRRVISVEILNPMTERVVLDEKLSILERKRGREPFVRSTLWAVPAKGS